MGLGLTLLFTNRANINQVPRQPGYPTTPPRNTTSSVIQNSWNQPLTESETRVINPDSQYIPGIVQNRSAPSDPRRASHHNAHDYDGQTPAHLVKPYGDIDPALRLEGFSDIDFPTTAYGSANNAGPASPVANNRPVNNSAAMQNPGTGSPNHPSNSAAMQLSPGTGFTNRRSSSSKGGPSVSIYFDTVLYWCPVNEVLLIHSAYAGREGQKGSEVV